MILNVHNLPQDVSEHELAGSAVVVIDVLRATTTICQALASGARKVVPFQEIEETLAAANRAGRANIVLGGERSGKRIEGFDLGNSPAEYTPHSVRGRTVYFTTTNGTQALYHARLAQRIVVGALVNLFAVVASVKSEPRIDVLCAGTDGRPTCEDILCAGAIVSRLREHSRHSSHINDAANQALREWENVCVAATVAGRSLNEQLALDFRDAPGGRNLLEIGLDGDLVDCAQVDCLDVAPELDVRQWRIVLPDAGKPSR